MPYLCAMIGFGDHPYYVDTNAAPLARDECCSIMGLALMHGLSGHDWKACLLMPIYKWLQLYSVGAFVLKVDITTTKYLLINPFCSASLHLEGSNYMYRWLAFCFMFVFPTINQFSLDDWCDDPAASQLGLAILHANLFHLCTGVFLAPGITLCSLFFSLIICV